MQTSARSRGTVPNLLNPFLGDYGTLLIHVPGDLWHYRGDEWMPDKALTRQQFIRLFHMAPPTNVPIGSWGIVGGLSDDVKCRDVNWTRPEIQAALDEFVDSLGSEYIKPDGHSVDTLSKGMRLGRKYKLDEVIAPAPVPARVRGHVSNRR